MSNSNSRNRNGREHSIREVAAMDASRLAVQHLSASQRSQYACKEQRRQKVQYPARKTLSGLDAKVKVSQSRSNWNKQTSVTLRGSVKGIHSKQKMEDKENFGRKPVQHNALARTAPATLETIQSPNLCDASEINRTFSTLSLEAKPDAKATENAQRNSLTKSFMLKKNLTEKKLMAEKLNSDSAPTKKPVLGVGPLKSEASLMNKPVLGAYRGKVMQSKINSFRKVSDEPLQSQAHAITLPRNTEKTQPPNSVAVGRGNIVKAKNALLKVSEKNPLNKAQPTTVLKCTAKLQVSSSAAASGGKTVRSKVIENEKLEAQATTIKQTAELQSSSSTDPIRRSSVTTCMKSTSFAHFRPAARPSSSHSDFPNKPKQAASLVISKGKTNPPTRNSCIGCLDFLTKEKQLTSDKSVRRKTNVYRPPLKPCPAIKLCSNDDQLNHVSDTKKSDFLSKRITPGASTRSVPASLHTKSVPEILSSVASRFSLPQESAEERRARLAEWQASKGKVMKRPPMVKVKVHSLEVPKQEPAQFLLESIREEDIQILSIDGEHGTVEYTNPNQPTDEPQNVFAHQNAGSPKSEIEEIMKAEQNNNKELVKSEENGKQVAQNEGVANESETEMEKILTMKKGKRISFKKNLSLSGACKKEEHEKDEVGDQPPGRMTPEQKCIESTVIRFNVRTTSLLQSMKKKIHVELGDCASLDLKFLTPVRRSRRIEQKSFQLPEMLQDHDPCLSSLGELAELGGEANAYIYRENNALGDFATATNEKQEK